MTSEKTKKAIRALVGEDVEKSYWSSQNICTRETEPEQIGGYQPRSDASFSGGLFSDKFKFHRCWTENTTARKNVPDWIK